MPPRDIRERTRLFALAVLAFCRRLPKIAAEEAGECVDWLEYLRDARIRHDAVLIQNAHEVASILTASLKTSRRNSARLKKLPNS